MTAAVDTRRACDGCGVPTLRKRVGGHRWCERCARTAARVRWRQTKRRARDRARCVYCGAPTTRTDAAGDLACGRACGCLRRPARATRWRRCAQVAAVCGASVAPVWLLVARRGLTPEAAVERVLARREAGL